MRVCMSLWAFPSVSFITFFRIYILYIRLQPVLSNSMFELNYLREIVEQAPGRKNHGEGITEEA